MKHIPLIIARVLLGAAKKEEKETLSEWENTSERNSLFANILKKYWTHPAPEIPHSRLEFAHNRLFARINSEQEMHSRKLTASFFLKIAAILVFIVSTSALSIYIASQSNLFNQTSWVEVSTETGQQSKVVLSDGSLVWLNAETVLKYRQTKETREVKLEGEAYFEVSHSPTHPFIVETGKTKVKVLGTKFNVSHYSNSEITEASLLSGKITMSVNGSEKEIELAPGEKVTYNEVNNQVLKGTAKVQNEISWRQGILVFDNEPFNEFLKKLERYYAVEFIYDKSAFKDMHYTGSLDNLNINKVLEFVNLTIPIRYEFDNNTITLKLNK